MAPPHDETGRVVAEKYRLRRIVGEGGMGLVYAAQHLWTDREVAVKVLHPHYARDERTVRRFLQEARAAARLHHPHVVDVLDMGQREDGSVYMVMEMLTGETLAEHLRRYGPLEPDEALDYVLPVMDALAVAHERGIVHRDLKPDNIFLDRDRRGRIVPKLLDFGIAKMVQAPTGTATEPGNIVGTPAYMSPEQVRGSAEVGPAADIWSVGIVLYEALSGQWPFRAETPTGILAAILTEDVPPLRETAVNAPEPLVAVIERALEKDPDARPSSMRAFEEAVAAAAAESSISRGVRASRIDWDPSMAESSTTGSVDTGLASMTKSLAPLVGPAVWLIGAAVVIFAAVTAGLVLGITRPWEPAEPSAQDAAEDAATLVARPPGPEAAEETQPASEHAETSADRAAAPDTTNSGDEDGDGDASAADGAKAETASPRATPVLGERVRSPRRAIEARKRPRSGRSRTPTADRPSDGPPASSEGASPSRAADTSDEPARDSPGTRGNEERILVDDHDLMVPSRWGDGDDSGE